MTEYMFKSQLVFFCILLAMGAQVVFAMEDTDDPKTVTAAEEEKKDDDGKRNKSNPLKTISDIILSPAHYAILLTGKLLPHDKDKGSAGVDADSVHNGSNITGKWNHKLPFMAQQAIDRGFKLPNPYGFSGIYSRTKQNISLSNLRISFGSDPNAPKTPVPFVTFQQAKTDARAWEAKPDAWILPFLNAYLISGRVDGEALIPIIVPGEGALKALLPTLGALCDKPAGFPGRPDGCDKVFVILDHSHYTGTNYGLGVTFAAGWKNFFAAIPISYVWSDLSNTSTRVTALNASGRVGYSIQPKRTGMLSFYTGASYLNTKQDVEGIFLFETGVPEIGEIEVNYKITEQGTKPWNYLVGFNWTLTPNWWVQAEVGFGGDRKDYITSLSYRW
jgi:hypothetical protein